VKLRLPRLFHEIDFILLLSSTTFKLIKCLTIGTWVFLLQFVEKLTLILLLENIGQIPFLLRFAFISKLRFDAVVSLLILRIILKKASFEIRTAKCDAQSWIIEIETILSATSLHIIFLIDRLGDPLSRSISISIRIVDLWIVSSLRNDVVPFGLQNSEFSIIVICSLVNFLDNSAILTHSNYFLLRFISLNFMNISVVIVLLFYLFQHAFNT
jgi:hypothetical protein